MEENEEIFKKVSQKTQQIAQKTQQIDKRLNKKHKRLIKETQKTQQRDTKDSTNSNKTESIHSMTARWIESNQSTYLDQIGSIVNC